MWPAEAPSHEFHVFAKRSSGSEGTGSLSTLYFAPRLHFSSPFFFFASMLLTPNSCDEIVHFSCSPQLLTTLQLCIPVSFLSELPPIMFGTDIERGLPRIGDH